MERTQQTKQLSDAMTVLCDGVSLNGHCYEPATCRLVKDSTAHSFEVLQHFCDRHRQIVKLLFSSAKFVDVER